MRALLRDLPGPNCGFLLPMSPPPGRPPQGDWGETDHHMGTATMVAPSTRVPLCIIPAGCAWLLGGAAAARHERFRARVGARTSPASAVMQSQFDDSAVVRRSAAMWREKPRLNLERKTQNESEHPPTSVTAMRQSQRSQAEPPHERLNAAISHQDTQREGSRGRDAACSGHGSEDTDRPLTLNRGRHYSGTHLCTVGAGRQLPRGATPPTASH